MLRFTHVFLLFCFTILSTVDTRAIQQNSTVDLLVTNRINENKQLSGTIASYRHRFEHSPNFKKLRWALHQQLTPPYCQFCHVFIPVVCIMYTYVLKLYCFCLRFDCSSKLIKRSTWKMSLLLYVKISEFFSILMFVSEPYTNIR
jgi:hypothetical protein